METGCTDLVYSCHNLHIKGPKGISSRKLGFDHFHVISQQDAEEFYREGFFIAESCVDSLIIDSARRYIDDNYFKFLKASKRQDDWRIHFQLDLTNAELNVEHAPILDLLLKSPKIMGRLKCLLGCELAGIFYSQIALRTPVTSGSREEFYSPGAEYHIDGQANASGDRFPDPWSVQVGIALVDMITEDMGNFTVFPKGHVSRSWRDYCEEKKTKTLPNLGPPHKICLKAGDVVFVHCLLPHRGGKNIHLVTDEEISSFSIVNNIPKKTREMVFIRIKGENINYEAPERSSKVIEDPWDDFKSFLAKYNLG